MGQALIAAAGSYCIVALTALACSAQPFSSLDIGAGATSNLISPDIGSHWKRGVGGDLNARLPFYSGVLEGGVSLQRYGARSSEVPPFGAILAFAGWGLRTSQVAGFQAYAGGRLGIFTMVFDQRVELRNRSGYESEMAVAPVVALQYRIASGWSAYVEAQQLIVLTASWLHFTYLTIGVRRAIATPTWLRAFLE